MLDSPFCALRECGSAGTSAVTRLARRPTERRLHVESLMRMAFYVIVFCILWAGFLGSVLMGRRNILFEYVALAVFILVAGQRFETGNDWLVYRDHYADLQAFGIFNVAADGLLVFEPLYVITTWFFGIFLRFQEFLLVVALFNGIVLYWFARVWRANFCGVAAIYYSWLYLAAQMATIRYSIAISFFMLAIIFLLRQRKWIAFSLAIVAAGYHTFSIALVPLLFLIDRRFDFRQMFFVLVVAGVGVYVLFSALISGWGGGVPFVEKLVFYLQEGAVDGLSFGLIGYIGINFAFLFWIKNHSNDDAEYRLIEWSVFYLIFFQIVLWVFPIFWNRVQVVVLTIQACVIARYAVDRRHVLLFSFGMVISLFVLLRSLLAPAFVSYLPYQSYWIDEVLLDSVGNDGEVRYFEALDQQQLSNEK